MALSTSRDDVTFGCGLKPLASGSYQYLLGAKFIVSAMFDTTGAAIGAMPSTANTAIPTKSIVVTLDMIASFQD